ncbi:MAG: ABC transporter permease [Planctomycetes bacterium]|nr:ABC transporter permease [Planctomycetota bacterium]
MTTLVKLTWIEAKLLLRDPITVVFTLPLPLIFLFVLAEVFTRTSAEGLYRDKNAIDFYASAYIGLVMSAVGLISLPTHIARYREVGVLRRFRASSISKWSVIGSQIIISIVIICVSSGVLITAISVAYDLKPPEQIGAIVAAVLLGSLTFAVLGICLGTLLPTSRSAQLAGLILFFVMLLLSGAGPPPELLGDTLNSVADMLPLTHVVKLIQDPWLGFGWNNTELLIVLGILAVSGLLAIRFFKWE